jgi:ABC-type amino acid transport substrate-binding protein
MKTIKNNGTYIKIFEKYFGAGHINKKTLAADFKQ